MQIEKKYIKQLKKQALIKLIFTLCYRLKNYK